MTYRFMTIVFRPNAVVAGLMVASVLAISCGFKEAVACPFCNAVSQTLRQEMAVMDAVVIATSVKGNTSRNEETGEVRMTIETVLKGEDLISRGQEVQAIYYGDVKPGRRFMLSGVDPPEMQWSCLPLSERAEAYVIKITELPDDDVARLRYYYDFLQDEESMLARDAYDEFAIAPYSAVKGLAPEIDQNDLIEWIKETETSVDRKRLYLTMLGVCGSKADLPFLEQMLRSDQKSTRSGLDALVACYLTLAGEKGLPLVNELFLNNKKAPYADTYAAIMAIRFHGTEGGVISRSALTESLHYVLDREDLADLVIPDLARWSDWSQIDKMKRLFVNADADNNWVRVPVVNYLRACPLPDAEKALEELKKVDPESVKRANTFFSIPVPAKEQPSTGVQSSTRPSARPSTSASTALSFSEGPLAANGTSAAVPAFLPVSDPGQAVNPWRLACVVLLSFTTLVLGQYLVLSGGPPADQT